MFLRILFICFLFIAFRFSGYAQDDNPVRRPTANYGQKRGNNPKSSGDTTIGFKHRDDLKDSITISYRFLDSLKNNKLDSSLSDFNSYFSIPSKYVTLGNNGSPGFPVLFTPVLRPGWDEGLHALDIYKFKLENTKFFHTTKPYTQLTYLLASGKEQFVNALHTQNILPSWNFGFEYKLISAPGFFKTQNTSHNSYRLFSNYQGKKKRYAAYLVLVGNKLKASENGGIRNNANLDSSKYADRFVIPVNLGGDPQQKNVFSTNVSTGNNYSDFTFFLRQSYDFGKKDSIEINDSTKEYLFYPKLRFQHTVTYNTYTYRFVDTLGSLHATSELMQDSSIFKQWYDTAINISAGFNFQIKERWKVLTNDFSIRQFPETKNTAQYIEAGLRIENLTHIQDAGQRSFYNLVGHGEYRNKTRNKKWDAIAKGELYFTGFNAGDFNIYASLTRYLNSKLGDVELLFQNVNRTPSFIFNNQSSFNFKNNFSNKKENIILISVATQNPKFTLAGRNISLVNYSYFKNYYQTDQYSSLINLTQAELIKKTSLKKHLNLYSDFIVQQTTSSSPIHVPFFYTRQRIVFEGVYFKNLNLATGIDLNYNTSYKENNYSPVMGQFFAQDTSLIKNRPNVSAFFDFRIKSFRGLLKLENLNTMDFSNGFGFTKNNFAAPHYPTNGLVFRIGVQWVFVN